MSLNIHPIIVHFPVALLTLYALIELIPFAVVRKNKSVQVIKLFLLFIGEMGAVAAGLTGSLASHGSKTNPDIRYPNVIHTHSAFAQLTFIVFGLITLLYISQLLNQYYKKVSVPELIVTLSTYYWVLAPLALIGITTLTITGALGGVVVYGPDLDPFTHFVYQLLIH